MARLCLRLETADYNENHGEGGRFASSGGGGGGSSSGGSSGKSKSSSSSLTNGSSGAKISSKERIKSTPRKPKLRRGEADMVRHELNTWIDKNPVKQGIISKPIRNNVYIVKVNDFDDYEILGRTPIRAKPKKGKK